MFRKLLSIVPVFLFSIAVAEEQVDLLSKNASFFTSVQKISDDDFFDLYKSSCEQYAERFVSWNELYERTVQTADPDVLEVTIPNPDAIICREKVRKLVSAADYWYSRQVNFAEACLSTVDKAAQKASPRAATKGEALLAEYKKMIRYHLLADLAKLTSTFWNVDRHSSWEKLPEVEYTPFEEGITSYISGGPSEDRCMSLVLKMRRNRMESMRDAIVTLMSDEDDNHSLFTHERNGMTREQLRLFREAERAWEMYYTAASDCVIPVWTSNCGSGTNEIVLKFNIWLISTHADLLHNILTFNRPNIE